MINFDICNKENCRKIIWKFEMRRKSYIIIIFFINIVFLNAQSFKAFDIDASKFPTIKAKFYAFDASGKQITNVSNSDFKITENGIPSKVINVSCPAPKPPVALSSVLVMDISGSMSSGPPRIESAKQAANAWVDGLPLGLSECALVSFSDNAFINQDFTTNRTKLKNNIAQFSPTSGTNYNQALIDLPCGALQVAASGKHKRVIVFLTDGLPNFEPNTQEIINFAIQNQITIYAVTLDMPAPQCIKEMTKKTGGEYFENITTTKEAAVTYQKLLQLASNIEPCTIEWERDYQCNSGNISAIIEYKGIASNLNYQYPSNLIANLVFSPFSIYFKNKIPGIKADTIISVNAIYSDFKVSKITFSDPNYSISPNSFNLKKGELINLTLSFTPPDSNSYFCTFTFENDICAKTYKAMGGFLGKKFNNKTLKLTHPNGGEEFVIGNDTVITWEGVLNTDKVRLDFTNDDGKTWKLINKSTSDLRYIWHDIPNPTSNLCKVKVSKYTPSIDSKYLGDLLNSLDIFDIYQIKWSPDNTKILIATGKLYIFDPVSGNIIKELKSLNPITYAIWSPDGNQVLSLEVNNIWILWDANTGEKLMNLSGHYINGKHVWSKDGTKLLICDNKNVNIIDIRNGNVFLSLNSQNFTSADWNFDESKIVTSSYDSTSVIWDANTGIKIHTLSNHKNFVMNAIWSPDDSKIATIGLDSTLIVWDSNTGTKLFEFKTHVWNSESIIWSPNSKKLITKYNDSLVILFDVINGSVERFLENYQSTSNSDFWSPDGSKVILTPKYKKYALVMDVNSLKIIDTLQVDYGDFKDLRWSKDGNKIAVSFWWSNRLFIYDVNTTKIIMKFSGHNGGIDDISWSPDGSKILSNTNNSDFTAIIWDAEDGLHLKNLFHDKYIKSAKWSPDGSKILTSSTDSTIVIWDAVSGNKIRTFLTNTYGYINVAWSPDGNRFIQYGNNKSIIIWDANSGSKLFTMVEPSGFYPSAFWSPNGKMILSYSNKIATIWDANSGNSLSSLNGHTGVINSANWSPDGSRIITSSMDSTSIIWDAISGLMLKKLKGHKDQVNHANWNFDGSQVVTASNDKQLIVWNSYTGDSILHINHIYKFNSVNWSPDGTYLLSNSGNSFDIWDPVSRKHIFEKEWHENYFHNAVWSPNGSKVATSRGIIGEIWYVEPKSDFDQEDVSDTLFSIVAPQASSKDIDMKQVLVGSAKDTLVKGFISNVGSYKIRIDSIFFTGADASTFSMVSGFPKYEIAVADNKSCEFRFIPNRVGIHNATINIITQADTLRYSIQGEGVQPRLQILTKLLDFGKIEIGKENTFQDTALLKNLSGFDITVNDVVHLGPDTTQFDIISGGGKFTITPGEERKLTVKFKPKYGGRTSGQLGFVYSGVGSPSVAQLFGQGIGGSVTISNDSAYAGENRILKLVMDKVKPEGIAAIAPNFEAKIRFQRTILATLNNNDWFISGDSIYLTIKGKIGTSLELAQIPVVAGLGNVESTNIDIIDIFLKDDFGNRVDYDFETQSGFFKLLGICNEGGTRLINPDGKAVLMSISPNPSDGNVTIDLNLIEKGNTSLKIYNSTGEIVYELKFEEFSGNKILNIETTYLSTGLYFVSLQTPTINKLEQLIIYK